MEGCIRPDFILCAPPAGLMPGPVT